jgi:hypothetical protein
MMENLPGKPVMQLRFDIDTSQIQAESGTATTIYLVE